MKKQKKPKISEVKLQDSGGSIMVKGTKEFVDRYVKIIEDEMEKG